MTPLLPAFNNRILIVDDNEAIHADFRKIFSVESSKHSSIQSAEDRLFGVTTKAIVEPCYIIDSAYQGSEAIAAVQRAADSNAPYALAFVDVRMPPGLDGIETIERIWKEHSGLQIAVCTAYSDYSWTDMLQRLGVTDSLLILKKPFDTVEVRQIACAMTSKWNLNQDRLRERSELIEARKTADQANNFKSAFLANMSHEIRTPMNAVIGLNYLMKQTPMTPKQYDYASKIDFAATNLMGIINDILDFSKIEAGKIDLEHAEFNLQEVLSHVTQSTALQAQKKSVEFLLSIAPNTPQMIIGDALRLGQVLLNLANNAIKFTEKGRIVLKIKPVDSDNPAESFIQFSVTDSGIGMSEKQLERLFEPFHQADVSTSRRFGGTGLGLAISTRFVNLMGGKLAVQSVLGKGSTFSFIARFGRVLKSPANWGTSSGQLATVRRALLVNCDEPSRLLLSRLLKTISIDSASADSYDDAAQEVGRTNGSLDSAYDLAIVNCSSLELAACFKYMCSRTAARIQPRIILLVSQSMGDLQFYVQDKDFDGMLIKPITDSALYESILRATTSHGQENIAPKPEELARSHIDGILRGAKILLVEDNDINQQIATEVISIAGCEMTVASSGLDALTILKSPTKPEFDIILMDIQMPEMDGHAATREIRTDPRYRHVPILAMTADTIMSVKQECLSEGMNDFISKPFNCEQLYSTLALWVYRARECKTNNSDLPVEATESNERP